MKSPSGICGLLSCSDPQTAALKCLNTQNYEYLEKLLNEESILLGNDWLNTPFSDDKNLLHIALEISDVSFVTLLLQHGARADYYNEDLDISMIHVAVESGDVSKVSALLEYPGNKANPNVTTQPSGQTPLHISIFQSVHLTERLLKESSLRINARDNLGGQTALYLAAKGGKVKHIETLVRHGANVSDVIHGSSVKDIIALKAPSLDLSHLTIISHSINSFDYLVETYDRRDFYLFSSILSFLSSEDLKGEGVKGSTGGSSLLQKAASDGLSNYVEALLSAGVNPNEVTTENPVPPLLLAAGGAHDRVFEILIAHERIDVSQFRRDTQETLLMILLKKSLEDKDEEYERMLEILLKGGFSLELSDNINARDSLGNTALHYGAKFWSSSRIQELLSLGANLSLPNIQGLIPLQYIASSTLETYLDEICMNLEGEEIHFKYDFLAPPFKDSEFSSLESGFSSKSPGIPIYLETETLFHLSISKTHRHLLKHPVLRSFMWLKWQRFRKYFNRYLRLYSLFVSLVTWYIFARFGGTSYGFRSPKEPFCSPLKSTERSLDVFYFLFLIFSLFQGLMLVIEIKREFRVIIGSTRSDSSSKRQKLSTVLQLFSNWTPELFLLLLCTLILVRNLGALEYSLICLYSLLLFVEGFQILSSLQLYFFSFENLLQVLLLGLLGIVLLLGSSSSSFVSCSLLRHLSSLILLLSWSELTTLIARHPCLSSYNIYVTIFYKVLKTFFSFLLWYFFFLMAFASGFYIMLHRDIGISSYNESTTTLRTTDKETLLYNSNSTYVFFDSPWTSLVKTLTMFVGEIEFSDLPLELYPSLSYLYLLLFVFLIIVVLMNLLNGLAVSDIKAIREKAEIVTHVSRVQVISHVESTLLGAPLTSSSHFQFRSCSSLSLLSVLTTRSPAFYRFLTKMTGLSNFLLFTSLLTNKSASFPLILKKLTGSTLRSSIDEEVKEFMEEALTKLRKRKEILRNQKKEKKKDSLEEIYKKTNEILSLLKTQSEEVQGLKSQLGIS